MNARFENFDSEFDANTQSLLDQAENDLAFLKDPYTPMVLNMEPGAEIGADGQLIQAPSFEMSLRKKAGDEGGLDWGDGIGGSTLPPLMGTSLGTIKIILYLQSSLPNWTPLTGTHRPN